MAGFAAVHDVGVGHIDLDDFRVPDFGFILQAGELGIRQIDHVLGDVSVELLFLFVDGLDEFAEFRGELGALVP